MLEFNSYLWELYRESPLGKELISQFEHFDHKAIAKRLETETYIDELSEEDIDEYKNKQQLGSLFVTPNEIDFSILYHDFLSSYEFEKPEETYEQIIDNELDLKSLNHTLPAKSYQYIIHTIDLFSVALYKCEKVLFIPYFFKTNFFFFQRICKTFHIPVPPLPKKSDWRARALYYLELCKSLHLFRKTHNLSRSELCAFIYDFAANNVKRLESPALPSPRKAWFVGGNKNDFDFVDNATATDISRWQGNVDTRRGDIIVMYCLSPRSYIHSIWRAHSDGFIDPFFHYYNMVFISNPQRIAPITQQELKNSPLFSVNLLIRKNLQGINGYPLSFDEYQELLKLIASKQESTESLPNIEPNASTKVNILNERDVEIQLVEPFLVRLGFSEKDWIRQMPIKMGRGERNYPDYCFAANNKRGEESAPMLLETKLSITTSKNLDDAFIQAKSYALRLQSKVIVVASQESVWIFERNNGSFDINEHLSYTWYQLNHPDNFHQALKIIGKQRIDTF